MVARICATPPAMANFQKRSGIDGMPWSEPSEYRQTTSIASGAEKRNLANVAPPAESPASVSHFCSMNLNVCASAAATVMNTHGSIGGLPSGHKLSSGEDGQPDP